MKCKTYLIFFVIMASAFLNVVYAYPYVNDQNPAPSINDYQAVVNANNALMMKNAALRQQKVKDTLAAQKQQNQQSVAAAQIALQQKITTAQQASTSSLEAQEKPSKDEIKKLQKESKGASDGKSQAQADSSVGFCDCYDTSSPYNYPSNFIYNHQNMRIQRISPFCRCQLKKSAVDVAEPTTQMTQAVTQQPALVLPRVIMKTTQPVTTAPSTSGWHIDY